MKNNILIRNTIPIDGTTCHGCGKVTQKFNWLKDQNILKGDINQKDLKLVLFQPPKSNVIWSVRLCINCLKKLKNLITKEIK